MAELLVPESYVPARRRTFSRVFYGQELFSGNRETLTNVLFSRESILLWGLRTFHRPRRDYRRLMRSGKHRNMEFIGHAFELTGTYGRLTGLVVDEPWLRREIGKMLLRRVVF